MRRGPKFEWYPSADYFPSRKHGLFIHRTKGYGGFVNCIFYTLNIENKFFYSDSLCFLEETNNPILFKRKWLTLNECKGISATQMVRAVETGNGDYAFSFLKGSVINQLINGSYIDVRSLSKKEKLRKRFFLIIK